MQRDDDGASRLDRQIEPAIAGAEGLAAQAVGPSFGGPTRGVSCLVMRDITPRDRSLINDRGEVIIVPTRNNRQTGKGAASAASKVLANSKSTKAEKSAAASALSQTPSRKR